MMTKDKNRPWINTESLSSKWVVESHTHVKAYHVTMQQLRNLPEAMQLVGLGGRMGAWTKPDGGFDR